MMMALPTRQVRERNIKEYLPEYLIKEVVIWLKD